MPSNLTLKLGHLNWTSLLSYTTTMLVYFWWKIKQSYTKTFLSDHKNLNLPQQYNPISEKFLNPLTVHKARLSDVECSCLASSRDCTFFNLTKIHWGLQSQNISITHLKTIITWTSNVKNVMLPYLGFMLTYKIYVSCPTWKLCDNSPSRHKLKYFRFFYQDENVNNSNHFCYFISDRHTPCISKDRTNIQHSGQKTKKNISWKSLSFYTRSLPLGMYSAHSHQYLAAPMNLPGGLTGKSQSMLGRKTCQCWGWPWGLASSVDWYCLWTAAEVYWTSWFESLGPQIQPAWQSTSLWMRKTECLSMEFE